MNPSSKTALYYRISDSLKLLPIEENTESKSNGNAVVGVNNIHPPAYSMPKNVDIEKDWIFCEKCQKQHPQVKKVKKNVNAVVKSVKASRKVDSKIWDDLTPDFLKGGI